MMGRTAGNLFGMFGTSWRSGSPAASGGSGLRVVGARRAGALAAALSLSLLLCAALSLAWSASAGAMPASDQVITLKQPGGNSFAARQYGDEWNHGYETREGYTIVRNRETKVWEYAVDPPQSNSLKASGQVVGAEAPPPGLDKHLRPDAVEVPTIEYPEPDATNEPSMSAASVEKISGPSRASVNTGEHKSLVILVQFTDQASLGTTPAQWNSKYFGESNSVRDFYQKASYGDLNITAAADSHGTANDGVVGWLTLPYAHPNTANFENDVADRLLTRDAVKAADPHVNFSAYDTAPRDGYLSSKELHVTVIAAGYEGSCCRTWGKAQWGHYWQLYGATEQPTVDNVVFGDPAHGGGYTQFGEMHGNNMATLGIMVHEIGHDLGMPDLYDVTPRNASDSEGVGDWSVMGSGSWNRVSTQFAQGTMPALPDAWSRWYEGWLTPRRVSGTQPVPAAANSDAVFQLRDNPNGVDWTNDVRSGTGEYFLVENRQKVGYDAGLPGCGLLAWHIDETRVANNLANGDETRKLVDLEEADGLDQLDSMANEGDAGDPYPGSANRTRFDDTSYPNSRLYNATTSSGVGMTTSSATCAENMNATFTDPGAGQVPANDAFAGAQQLTMTDNVATASGNNANASKESAGGEPNHAGNTGGKSVWYRWTAPSSGQLAVDTKGSAFDTLLGVYTGSALNALTQITSNDDEDRTNNVLTSKVDPFPVVSGQTYRIAVDGYDNNGAGAVSGNVALKLTFTPDGGGGADGVAPAVSLTSPPDGATVGGASVALAAEATDNSGSVSRVDFFVGGAKVGTDTTAGGASGNEFSYSWNSSGTPDGSAGVQARAYDAASNEGVSASRNVTVRNTARPANDDLAGAEQLLSSGNAASASGNNAEATKEAGEPNHAGNPGGKSLWYRWTAPSNGQLTVDTTGSSFDTTLGVYTGSSASALNLVASNDDENNAGSVFTSMTAFAASSGQTYRIAVDGYNDGGGADSGSVSMHLSFVESQAPVVALTAPTSGATVSGTSVNLAANAADNRGVSRVDFYAKGVKVGSDTTPGGTNGQGYSVLWNSKTVGNGSITVQAKAYDAAGNTASTELRSVNVNNPVVVMPKISSSTPAPDKTGIGRKAPVRIAFNKAMNRTTLNKGNIAVYRQGASSPISATVTPNSTNNAVTIDPYGVTSTRLMANTWYQVVVWKDADGVKDTAGNALQGASPYKTSTNGAYVYFWFKTGAS